MNLNGKECEADKSSLDLTLTPSKRGLVELRRHSSGTTDTMSSGGSFSYQQSPLHLHLSNLRSRRKFSFPVALEHGTHYGRAVGSTSARRRFSDAVSRRLSLSWRQHYGPGGPSGLFSQQQQESAAWEERQVVAQAKALARRYLRARLKRSGLLKGGKGGLARLRSSTMLLPSPPSSGSSSSESIPSTLSKVPRSGEMGAASPVNHVLLSIGQELESTHPKNENEVTWAKVVSLFAMAGGLAVDCVRRGHHDYLPSLVEAVGDVIEEEQLSEWIAQRGGWMGLVYHFRPERLEKSSLNYWWVSQTCLVGVITALSASVLLLVAVLLRWSGKFSFI
ncbi:hypothetical protein J437_LFUL005421 [Ladona fulva]|uniref:Bcl-2 Bcl-2 homology region 1-3 domain-containing protein n=1 Tax=Ladona fulva TaxID=123851 RepID=A0A8K0K0U1_LADFU|nr:hypothetical protein J437_LFUL005421 [Ladona fulva]